LDPEGDSAGLPDLDVCAADQVGIDASPQEALSDSDESALYSRVACTGVTHDFEAGEDTVRNWDGHRGGGYLSSRHNVCVFHNLCIGNGGEITMFLPQRADSVPSESMAYNEEQNHIGYVRLSAFESWEGLNRVHSNQSWQHGDYPGWRPSVKRSFIPKAYRFADDAQLHVLQRHTYFFQHFGHLLVDDLLAAFAGMQLFSLDSFDAVLVLMPSCPCCFPETAHQLCSSFFWNNESMARAIFTGGAKKLSTYAEGTCFKRVLMGHSSALSSVYPNPLISVVARKFRSLLVKFFVGDGVQYLSDQWQRGPEAALVNVTLQQVDTNVYFAPRAVDLASLLFFSNTLSGRSVELVQMELLS
jgi:hypothetical protein